MLNADNHIMEEADGVPVGLRPMTPEEIRARDRREKERERLQELAQAATGQVTRETE